jgi:urease alpha subunit
MESFAGPIVNIHFQIGRKSLDCAKFGICDGGIDVSWKYSTMQINDETKTLQIAFTKEVISGKEEYFRGNTVSFEESFILPADVQKALGSRNTITIGVGTYNLIKTSKGFQINIPIK